MTAQEVSSNIITESYSNRINAINNYGSAGSDSNGETPPDSVTIRSVTQDKNGNWIEQGDTKNKFVQTPLQIVNQKDEDRLAVISNYENTASPYDKNMYDYNNQINLKKLQIVNLVTSAVSFDCHVTDAISSSNTGTQTLVVNGVAIGVGEPIYEEDGFFYNRYNKVIGYNTNVINDATNINVHPNLYTSSNQIFTTEVQTLTPSNFGKGYETVIVDNGGSVTGEYKTITDNLEGTFDILPPHIYTPGPYSPVCAGYAASVLTIASEIAQLRNQRNQYIGSVNLIKKDKNKEEVISWGRNKTFSSLGVQKSQLQAAASNITSVNQSITIDGLVLYFDATKDYTIKTSIQNTTGINQFLQWDSSSGNASVAIASTVTPTFSSDDGPSAWFNQYGIKTKYFDLPSSYVDDNYGISSGNVSYTLESWIKITDEFILTNNLNTGGASIVGVASTAGIGLQVYKPFGLRINAGRGNQTLQNTTDLLPNKWYHVAFVREVGVNNRIYINGQIDNSSDISQLSVVTSNLPMRIGFCTSNYLQKYFPGKISVIRMYNRALSDSEIFKNYNGEKSRYS